MNNEFITTDDDAMFKNRRVTHYSITYNNPGVAANHQDFITASFGEDVEFIRCAVWQYEHGDSGTPHYQGWITFEKSVRWGFVKRHLPGAHIEPKHKSIQARYGSQYCEKDRGRIAGPFYFPEGKENYDAKFYGEQGKRSDLLAIKEAIDDGIPIKDVAKDHGPSWIRYHKGIRSYDDMCGTDWDPNEPITVIVINGDSGSGKSKYILNDQTFAMNQPAFMVNDNWFDGYKGEEIIVFDEFDSSAWRYREILQICDRYMQRYRIKGGFAKRKWNTVVFTSCLPVSEWWPKRDERVEFDRRVRFTLTMPNDADIPLAALRDAEPGLSKRDVALQHEQKLADEEEAKQDDDDISEYAALQRQISEELREPVEVPSSLPRTEPIGIDDLPDDLRRQMELNTPSTYVSSSEVSEGFFDPLRNVWPTDVIQSGYGYARTAGIRESDISSSELEEGSDHAPEFTRSRFLDLESRG